MKQLHIKVIPNAHHNSVDEGVDHITVRVTVSAVDGKANKAVITLLAKYFQVKARMIRIVRGETSRHKYIVIDEE